MARINIRRRTPELDKAIKGLEKIDPIARVAVTRLQGDLLTAFSNAGNLSNVKRNKRLSASYGAKKAASGRKAIRDLNLTGNLLRSFGTRKENKGQWSTGPRGSREQKIMEGNLKIDKNLMKVGKNYRNFLTEFVSKRILNGGKR